MRGAESVPKAESAVIRLSLRHLLDLEIRVHVTTVDIAHRVWLHQNVVKSGVEYSFLLVGAFNVDATQFFLPDIVSVLHVFVKVPALSLGKHVFTCTVVIDRRNRHFHDKFLIIRIVKTQSSA